MNLKLVTFEPDLTQFLVNADTYNLDSIWKCVRREAINKAIVAHIEYAKDQFGGFDDYPTLDEATDMENYSVEDVDMAMLLEIVKRKDWYPCLYNGAIVFGG